MESIFFKKIVDLISPYMDETRRRDLITPAFSGYPVLYSRIDWSGASYSFAVHLVELLNQYGEVEVGHTALSHLLQNILDQVGLQDQHKINKLLDELTQPVEPTLDPIKFPSRSTIFVNRTQEIQQIKNELRPGMILTICGVRGVGKSALLAEVLWRITEDGQAQTIFPDGIICHDFTSEPNVVSVLQKIIRTYSFDVVREKNYIPSLGEEMWSGIFPSKYMSRIQGIVEKLISGKTTLIVLDSIESADDLPKILNVLKGTRCGILMASNLRDLSHGKRVDIRPLDINDSITLLGELGKSRIQHPHDLSQIYMLVDGLPLALTLIGKYLDRAEQNSSEYIEMLEENIINSIDDIEPVLRHSMLALTYHAQRAMQVIGMLNFSSFSRDVIETALNLPERQISDVLEELINFGLLFRSAQRYNVTHRLIYSYACNLKIDAFWDWIQNPKFKFYKRLIVHYEKYVNQILDLEDGGEMELELPHITSLLGLSVIHSSAMQSSVLTLAKSTEEYFERWGHRGNWLERKRAVESGLFAAKRLRCKNDEQMFLKRLGFVYYNLGRLNESIDCYEKTIIMCKELNNDTELVHCLGDLGNAYNYIGKSDEAIGCLSVALKAFTAANEADGRATVLGHLGNAYRNVGEIDKAITHYRKGIQLSQAYESQLIRRNLLNNLGNAYSKTREVTLALTYYRDALNISEDLGDRHGKIATLGNIGNLYADEENWIEAFRYYTDALTISTETRYKRGQSSILGSWGAAYALQKKWDIALDYYQRAYEISAEIYDPQGVIKYLFYQGSVYQDRHEWRKAIDFYKLAWNKAEELEYRPLDLLGIQYRIASAYKSLGNYEKAEYWEKIVSPIDEKDSVDAVYEGIPLDLPTLILPFDLFKILHFLEISNKYIPSRIILDLLKRYNNKFSEYISNRFRRKHNRYRKLWY